MGCTASKLDKDDTVRRCKERRRLIKEAVYSRHHLAAAHSDYCRSLRITAAYLATFAAGEPLSFSDHTPAAASFIPPPPPSPMQSTSSRHFQKPAAPPSRRRPVKLPHILSDSSLTSSPPDNNYHSFTYNARRANSTYSTTPSQASSVWNWDAFYPPPSPPDSEYFNNLRNNEKNETGIDHSGSDSNDDDGHRYIDNGGDDKASNFTSYSNVRGRYKDPSDDRGLNCSLYSHSSNNKNYAGNYMRRSPDLVRKKGKNSRTWEMEEEETEREEVQCSEWGDHDHDYSSTSSISDEDEEGDLKSRSEFGTQSHFESMKNEGGSSVGNLNVNSNSKFAKKRSSRDDDKSSVGWRDGTGEGMNSEMRIVVRHKDLVEIVEAIRENFDKAASSGEQVSEMLEAGRAQLDRSFKHLRKTIYHSSGVLSNLSSSWTSKPPLAVKYRLESPSTIEQSGGQKSMCSTLERLLAWEKKLYQEVKAREGVKFEHEKKLSELQRQEYRREDDTKLDKTKASIKRLQSLIVVTSQAVSTTSSATDCLRDSHLVPQLVDLCHGFMYMWRSMNQFHQLQNDVVQQVRSLTINRMIKSKSTSDLQRQATIDLESAVSLWHSSFCRLIKFQRQFIFSLHSWYKLSLLPVDGSEPPSKELSKVLAFFDEWKLGLDRIPDTVASESINSLDNVVRSISSKQAEEIKIKRRAEKLSRELNRKASSLRNIERKYYGQSYSMVGIIEPPDSGPPDNGAVSDARDQLAEKKAELAGCQRRVEEEMIKHSKAVEVTRAMTLNNIQTGLPGVFQAMTSFSALMVEALESVCTRSYAIQ